MALMLIAVPASGIFAAFGGKGVRVALVCLGILFIGNLVIAHNVPEFGEYVFGVAIAAAFFSSIPILFGWHFGEFVRERRSSPGRRH